LTLLRDPEKPAAHFDCGWIPAFPLPTNAKNAFAEIMRDQKPFQSTTAVV